MSSLFIVEQLAKGRGIKITSITNNSNTKFIISEVQIKLSTYSFCYISFLFSTINTMFTVISHMWKLFLAMANRPLPISKTCKVTLF